MVLMAQSWGPGRYWGPGTWSRVSRICSWIRSGWGSWGEREVTGEPGLAESVGHGAVNCCWESVRGVRDVCARVCMCARGLGWVVYV